MESKMKNSLVDINKNLINFRAIHSNIQAEQKNIEMMDLQKKLNKLTISDGLNLDTLNEMDKVDSLLNVE